MCNCGKNEYTPVPSKLQDIIKHTAQEWTFRFTYVGDVKPGQFFQISIPKVGECPISVSGIGPDYVDLTLRAVGKVTDYLFENFKAGDSLFLRGPYGNGFDVHEYEGGELIIVVGGTAVSPVRGVVQYLCETESAKDVHMIRQCRAGHKIHSGYPDQRYQQVQGHRSRTSSDDQILYDRARQERPQ